MRQVRLIIVFAALLVGTLAWCEDEIPGENPGDEPIENPGDEPIEIPGDEPPVVSDSIWVLSLNNSLLDRNNQCEMFNSMAEMMGKKAKWTSHTNTGQTLAYHYNEDPLVPDAKTLISDSAWSYIILQEYSTLPRTNFKKFRENIATWVSFIRDSCPNPDVTIILPVNWARRDDEAFAEHNKKLIANTRLVAEEFDLTICPVGVAYGNYQADYPFLFTSDFYSDYIHPTIAATYLACCLEYAVIFDENPKDILWSPIILSETRARAMRYYAQEAYEGIERGVTDVCDSICHRFTSVTIGNRRTTNLIAHLHNESSTYYNTVDLTCNIEPFRSDTDSVFVTMSLYLSSDGMTWECINDSLDTLPTEKNLFYYPVECSLRTDSDVYIALSVSMAEALEPGDSSSLTIDSVILCPRFELRPPAYSVVITGTETLFEDFDCLGGERIDPSVNKRGYYELCTMPKGWKAERNTLDPNELGLYKNAVKTTTYVGGENMAYNAYHGIWNFGASYSSDRALGGVTTASKTGTHSVNIMVRLYNFTETVFTQLELSYDVEKYRNGTNSAGFSVTLYLSTDGENWESASSDLGVSFSPDMTMDGFEQVPAEVTTVQGVLSILLPEYSDLYLAWSIAPTSGTNSASGPALAIDNVSIRPIPSIPTHVASSAEEETGGRLILRNGVLYVLRNGALYTLTGQLYQSK